MISGKNIFTAILPLVMLLSCGGTGRSGDMIKTTAWQVLYNQTESVKAATSGTGWKKISVPSKLKLPYKAKRDYQYAWLRSTFNIPDSPSEYYGIHLSRIYYTDQVYINGRLIGQRTRDDTLSIHFPRNYTIPKDVLKTGKNSVYVRLGIYGTKFGGITGNVRILKEKPFKALMRRDNLMYHHMPLGMTVFLSCMMIFYTIFFIMYRKRIENLFIIIYISFYIALLILDIFGLNLFGHDVRLTFKDAMLTIIGATSFLLIQSLYRVYLPNINRGMVLYLVIALSVSFINIDTTSKYYFAEIISNSTLLLSDPVLIFTVIYANLVKPDRIKLILFILFVAIPGYEVTREIINHYFGSGFAEYSGIGFTIIYIIAYMLVLARNSIKGEIELQALYNELSRRNLRRKEEHGEDTDERIDIILKFIHDNYRSNITRDGLAATVKVSPDYLSKRFNSYTSKRIDEYINELRIKEAMELLKKSDKKIIDIAFSVGFESLSTFNRIFQKIVRETPRSFRSGIGTEQSC